MALGSKTGGGLSKLSLSDPGSIDRLYFVTEYESLTTAELEVPRFNLIFLC